MPGRLEATHGVICSMPRDLFGYFGWPSVTRMPDGTLVAAASGLRNEHVCPFGRSVICVSRDEGETWSHPRVVNDTPLDDRDTGIVSLGGKELLLTWFTSDNRTYVKPDSPHYPLWSRGLALVNDENVSVYAGAWVRRSTDGGESWEPPIRMGINTPHGPIVLANGELLYFGKYFGERLGRRRRGDGEILAARSTDGGRTWERIGEVPLYPGTVTDHYHEPHAVELPDGRLVGLIRFQNHSDAPKVEEMGLVHFSMMQTESEDGGRTWSTARPLGFHGSPPHLLRHSSGTLICTYGYRLKPFGQRVALSTDGGQSWEHDWILRDDGPDHDLGYPCTVELPGGDLFTVYYQKPETTADKCALLWSRWRLP